MMKGNGPIYDHIISELDIKHNDKVLEIGYGHGIGVKKISSNYDCFISGIDISELMFKEATKRNCKNIKDQKNNLKLGDFLKLEITPNQYDKVFCVHIIYFWDSLIESFSKIRAILKEGGEFQIFTANQDLIKRMKFANNYIFKNYLLEQVINELNNIGFKMTGYSSNNRGYFIKCRK